MPRRQYPGCSYDLHMSREAQLAGAEPYLWMLGGETTTITNVQNTDNWMSRNSWSTLSGVVWHPGTTLLNGNDPTVFANNFNTSRVIERRAAQAAYLNNGVLLWIAGKHYWNGNTNFFINNVYYSTDQVTHRLTYLYLHRYQHHHRLHRHHCHHPRHPHLQH